VIKKYQKEMIKKVDMALAGSLSARRSGKVECAVKKCQILTFKRIKSRLKALDFKDTFK
jgi:hypothetical protein